MTRVTIAAITWIWIAALPVTVRAQEAPAPKSEPAVPTSEPAENERNLIERWQARYSNLKSKGIALSLGTVLSGSSLAAGVEAGRDRLMGTSLGASIAGAWSIRGYQQYDLRVGIMKGRAHRAELEPIDSALSSVFNDNSLLAFGTSIFMHMRQRIYPRMDFFGLGQSTSVQGRTDYSLRGPSADIVAQWQPNRHVGLSARLGRLSLSLDEPTNRSIPDIQTVYTGAAAPALDAQPIYRATGAAITLDFRDQPRVTQSGSFMGLAIWRASHRPGDSSWTRMSLEARHFVRLTETRHVLAVRLLASGRLDRGKTPTPFYLQPTLGGSSTLRGFGSYRLRGEAVWSASAEYRWRAWKRVEIAPFLDVGAVSGGFSSLSTAGVAVTPGIGVRAVTDSHVIGRLDLARGRDGVRAIATVGGAF